MGETREIKQGTEEEYCVSGKGINERGVINLHNYYMRVEKFRVIILCRYDYEKESKRCMCEDFIFCTNS